MLLQLLLDASGSLHFRDHAYYPTHSLRVRVLQTSVPVPQLLGLALLYDRSDLPVHRVRHRGMQTRAAQEECQEGKVDTVKAMGHWHLFLQLGRPLYRYLEHNLLVPIESHQRGHAANNLDLLRKAAQDRLAVLHGRLQPSDTASLFDFRAVDEQDQNTYPPPGLYHAAYLSVPPADLHTPDSVR